MTLWMTQSKRHQEEKMIGTISKIIIESDFDRCSTNKDFVYHLFIEIMSYENNQITLR